MTPAGLELFNRRKTAPAAPMPAQLPKDLEEKFKKEAGAWGNFNRFPPFYKRMTIAWLASAKKEETRLKRLQQLIAYSSKNKRIKFM